MSEFEVSSKLRIVKELNKYIHAIMAHSPLHARLTRELNLQFRRKSNRTRHRNYQKKFEKRQKQKEKNKQSKLPITELFDLEHKGKLL